MIVNYELILGGSNKDIFNDLKMWPSSMYPDPTSLPPFRLLPTSNFENCAAREGESRPARSSSRLGFSRLQQRRTAYRGLLSGVRVRPFLLRAVPLSLATIMNGVCRAPLSERCTITDQPSTAR